MVVDLLVATNQALKGDTGPRAQGEDQMGWMAQPFWELCRDTCSLLRAVALGRLFVQDDPITARPEELEVAMPGL